MDNNVWRAALAARIQRDVEASGLSINELSLRTGISRPTLTRRLNGSPANTDELRSLATVLGVTASGWLRAVEENYLESAS